MAETINGVERLALTNLEAKAARDAGVLVLDERRRRPNYFDGRFLTAADLTDDQSYVLSRLTDLARTQGQGVSEGLLVSLTNPTDLANRPSTLRVRKGWGLTGSGELVGLPNDLVVDVGSLAQVQALNDRFGLGPRPVEPQRTLTGLFILALRPVEYTDGPIASYPTGVTGERRTEDGFIVEATAVTLIRYGGGGAGEAEEQRRRVTRDIFLLDALRLDSLAVLPLAIVALSRGVVLWVDNWLVRRELGAVDHGGLGLFGDTRARRQAHLLQYQGQLEELLEGRRDRGWQFAAAEHFDLLPPVGQLPREAILTPPAREDGAVGEAAFQQVFFPPEIETQLAILPEDELAGLIEEGLPLPPIDLTVSAKERDAVAVVILLPIARARLQGLLQRLAIANLSALRLRLRPAAPGQLARRSPLQILEGLSLPAGSDAATATQEGTNTVVGLWRMELQSVSTLWFARRRLFVDHQSVVRLTEVGS
jgi:hypothetical protein